ncbi:MAG: hypothetical protein SGPRY_005313 [Prymnesium sp.]
MPAPSHPECAIGLTGGLMWESSVVVVPAVYKEWGYPVRPPAWLTAQLVVYQYQRLNSSADCFARNVAFESGVYLRFIVDHYHNLPQHVVFAQADWFAQYKNQYYPYTPLDFWQITCLREAVRDHGLHRASTPEWVHWMPLGLRRSVWPPYQVRRVADFFASSYT